MHGRVTSTEQLTPGMVRVVLGGGDLERLEMPHATDAYVNVAFRPAAASYDQVFDPKAVRETAPQEEWPARRRYTVRSWDAETRELVVDFVVHADEGVASRWALTAQPGDVLVFEGPSGDYRPTPAADWHLLVGDESALPAIAVIAGARPRSERAIAVIEVQDETDELAIDGTEVHWVHRGSAGPGTPDHLVPVVETLAFPPGAGHGYLMGETRSMVALRAVLENRGLAHDAIFVKGYWNIGRPDRIAGRPPRE